MRILLTSHVYALPDLQARLEALAFLPEVDLTVVAPARWPEARLNVPKTIESPPGFRLIRLPVALARRNNAFFYLANLRRVLRDLRPDILHIEQEPCSTVTAQWLWAAGSGPRKIVFTWENVEQHWRPPQRWWEQMALARADAFIAGSGGALELLRAKGWRGPIYLLPVVGVEAGAARFSPTRAELKLDEMFVVGYVGRLVHEKGIDVLISACETLPAARLLLMGSGPWPDRLPHRPHVIHRPAIAHAEVPTYLRAMDVLVLPSRTTRRWKEQFGRVLIEAMACGVPVVGSDSGAIPETIGDVGLIFPEGDAQALSECLSRLQANPALRLELVRRGRKRATEFTHRRIAERTVEVYTSVSQSLRCAAGRRLRPTRLRPPPG